MCGKSFVYLRLGEHVQTPGAHPAVCGHGDQVVGVLCADHIHAVHWVLDKHKHTHTIIRRDKQMDLGEDLPVHNTKKLLSTVV